MGALHDARHQGAQPVVISHRLLSVSRVTIILFPKVYSALLSLTPQTRTTRREVTDYKPFNPRLITLCQSKFNQLKRCRNTNDEQKYYTFVN